MCGDRLRFLRKGASMKRALAAGILLIIARALAAGDVKPAPKPAPDEWIQFSGIAIDHGGDVLLVAWKDQGVLVVKKEDVKLDGAKPAIRVGAKVTIRAMKGAAVAADTHPLADMARNEGKHSHCFGLVELCCGSERALRACIGAWDCGHFEQTCDHDY
jgi:hypothetical protein